MQQTIYRLSAALAAVLAAGSAYASNSVVLDVTGTVTPASCNLVLSQPTIDLGNISSGALNESVPTKVGTGSSDINVTCTSATQFALQVLDDQQASVDAASATAVGAPTGYGYGLGSVAGVNVGAYAVGLSAGTAGTSGATFIRSTDGKSWAPTTLLQPGTTYTAWSTDGSTPASVNSAKATLDVTAAVTARQNLDLSSAVALAGKATIELHYL